ncbi:MAG: nuclear transport factor 2 family protein [marine benthic group bacterium]|nr:nuclear transport factor 2 family protein [Candidatus Benthicola marisminoris]
MSGVRIAGLACLALTMLVAPTLAQTEVTNSDERSVEQVVRDVYDLVSWTDGNTPDWEVVRDVFIPEAIIVLRYPPDLKVMSVDGFLLDWLRFQNQLEAAGVSGFQETVTSAAVTEFGDVAHVHVVYESSIPGTGRPARPGVDLWSLIRADDQWKVVSVVNELPRDDLPAPEFGE